MCYCVLGSTKVGIIVAESFAAVATLLIVATIIFFVRKNVLRQRRGTYLCVISMNVSGCLNFKCQVLIFYCNDVFTSERRQFGAFLFSENNSKLNMPYEVLEKATNYFHDSNKLGEGGSGSVYKVTSQFSSYLSLYIFTITTFA